MTHQNQQSGICAQQRLRSAWFSIQSDKSSLLDGDSLDPSQPFMHTGKTDEMRQMSRLIAGFAGRTSHFVGFVEWRLKRSQNYAYTAAADYWTMHCTILFNTDPIYRYASSLFSLQTFYTLYNRNLQFSTQTKPLWQT